MRWIDEEKAGELLRFVYNNPWSSFYRDRFELAGFKNPKTALEHFFELPLLSREELTGTPLERRTFVSMDEVRFVAATSGTSAKRPLMVPYTDVGHFYSDPSLGTEISRPLIVHPPMLRNFSRAFAQECREAPRTINPLFGDPQNLANSAFIGAAVGCDSVYAIPTIASLLAPYARESGLADRVRLLALTSETLTKVRRAELKRAYPNALIANLYGSTELGQLPFFSCDLMMKKEISHFHFLTEALTAVELIEDELMVTYGLNRATPLIRYKTGDCFAEVTQGCECGRPGPVLSWLPRKEVDRVRLNGIEFDAEAADAAFAKLPHLANVPYQVHFLEDGTSSMIRIELKAPELAGKETEKMAQACREVLLDSWRVSSQATIRAGLEKGLFTSLNVVIVPELTVVGTKLRRFVNHVK